MGRRPLVCDLGDLEHVDAGTVQALARLQLEARRRGCELRLRQAPRELRCLLELVGLSDVLGVEPRWQPEEREEPLGVEEERQLDDPSLGNLEHL